MLQRRLHEYALKCDGNGCERVGPFALCEFDAFTAAMHGTPRIMSRWDAGRVWHLCDACRGRTAPRSKRMLVAQPSPSRVSSDLARGLDPTRTATLVLHAITEAELCEILNRLFETYGDAVLLTGTVTMEGARSLGSFFPRNGGLFHGVRFTIIDGSDAACIITAVPRK